MKRSFDFRSADGSSARSPSPTPLSLRGKGRPDAPAGSGAQRTARPLVSPHDPRLQPASPCRVEATQRAPASEWLRRATRWFSPFLLLGLLHAADAKLARSTTRQANTVILDATAVKNLGLETAEVEERPFEETLFSLGRIDVLPGKRAVVTSRIPGRVVKVLAYPDQAVKTGDPLVVIESRQPGDPPPEITLTAPMDGLVTELIAVPGEPVSPDRPLLAIVDLSVVHAVARVPEQFTDQILQGQTVRVTSPGWPGEVWKTRVEHLGALADAASGTIEAVCHVNNEGTWLRPGMRAEFQFVTRSHPNVLVIPRSAVQGEGAQRFVFRTDEELPHTFVKTPIVVGDENDQFAEVKQGLFAGDEVVTRGAYPLAYAGRGTVSLKEALDAAHGHPHNEDGSEITGNQPDDHGHAHGHAPGQASGAFTPLTWFFAATSVLLLGLLVAQTLRRPSPTPEQNPPHA